MSGSTKLAALVLAASFYWLQPAAAQVTFSSPSGNITCYPEAETLICLIFDTDWSAVQSNALIPESGEECDLDRTAAFELPPQGPPVLMEYCHGDVFWPTENRFTLPYGFSLQSGSFNCASGKAGMECRNRAGHGFTVARAGYQILAP